MMDPFASKIEYVAFERLNLWPSNPRKQRGDAEERKVEELAASIEATGLIENLIARPINAGSNEFLEVIVGSRRLQALIRLYREGKITAGFQVPVQIRDLPHGEALALALVENMDRESLHPADEARGMAELFDLGMSVADIVAATGLTERTVSKRLALYQRLAPEALHALRHGEISLAVAQALCLGSPEQQKAFLAEADIAEYGPDDIREHMLEDELLRDAGDPMVAAFVAAHPAALRAPDLFADPNSTVVRINDRAAFAAFAEDWHRVQNAAAQPAAQPAAGDAVTLAEIADAVTEGVAAGIAEARAPAATTEPAPPAAAAPEPEAPAELLPKRVVAAANRLRTDALQAAVGQLPRMAMALVVLALAAGEDQVLLASRAGTLRPDDTGPTRRPIDVRIEKLMAPHRARMNRRGKTSSAQFLDWLMVDEDMESLFAALVAKHMGAWNRGDPQLAVTPLVAAVAADLGAAVPEEQAYSLAYLETYALPNLRRLAAQIGGKVAAEARKMSKRADLLALLHDKGPGQGLPPELRWLPDMPAALAAFAAPPPAETAPKPAKRKRPAKGKRR